MRAAAAPRRPMPLAGLLLLPVLTGATAELVTVDTSKVTHQVDPLFMGCHTDLGFAHEQRNFYAQMVYGESFEFGNASSWKYSKPSWDEFPTAATSTGLKWNRLVDTAAQATVDFDSTQAHHGYASLKIDYKSGSGGFAGSTNRGIGNEGLYLVAGKEYEGYFFAKATGKPAQVAVKLRSFVGTEATLAEQHITIAASTEWTRYNFSFTTSTGTNCTAITPGSDPSVDCHTQRGHMAGPPNTAQGHICIKCGGEFAIGLTAPGTVHVDYVFLQPGSWGRYGEGPFLKDGVDVLKTMGISAIRLGGSFTDPSYYFCE